MKNFNGITKFFFGGIILIAIFMVLIGLMTLSSYNYYDLSGPKSLTLLFSGAMGIYAFTMACLNKNNAIFLAKLFCFLSLASSVYMLPISKSGYYFFILILLVLMPIVCFIYFKAEPADITEIMPEEERKALLIDKILLVISIIIGLISLMILVASSYSPNYSY